MAYEASASCSSGLSAPPDLSTSALPWLVPAEWGAGPGTADAANYQGCPADHVSGQGASRSKSSTPQLRADDLSQLLIHLDAGLVAVSGSSGGAVTALALTRSHPAQVHTVIAHEPDHDPPLKIT